VWTTAILPLAGGADAVWRGFRSSIRAAVRQARRFGLTCRSGQGELAGFYDVLAENMRRKGAPIYGRRFLAGVLEQFGASAGVVTVWLDGRVIAGALTLTHGDVAYVPFASARPASFPKRPNNLLYWHVIERACAAGLAWLDFGTSLKGASTLAFKLGWGARLVPTPSFLHGRRLRGAARSRHPGDPRGSALVAEPPARCRGSVGALCVAADGLNGL
jgi:lipid II:glycine glycyltransferase (peptidoglycan interpeptide bridge formation enzyme)